MKNYISFKEIKEDLLTGEASCVSLTQNYIRKINDNLEINAFLEVFEDSAIAKAQEVDEKLKNGNAGKLAGMVIGIKDNICYKNHKVSASSKMLEGYESIYTATAIQKLLDEDAIIIGRLNCDEFAMGSSNENSAFGSVKNPLDYERVPGGSSGGSVAAVKAGLCFASLGSDTGGSIRQPSSFCGTIGLKPTYGRISRYGLLAYASSFDQIGPITHTVEDSALLLEVMAGKDKLDATSSSKKVENYSQFDKNKKYKVGIPREMVSNPSLDATIKKQFNKFVNEIEEQGHEVSFIDFKYLDYLVPSYYVLCNAESSSNLSRYDGGHYGYRSPNATDIESTYILSRCEGFGKEVKRRIMLGTFVLSAGYFDSYYTQAQKIRRLLYDETLQFFDQFDLMIHPTTPTVAFKHNDFKDPISMYLQDIYTVYANLVGCPAISIPYGTHPDNNLPIGMQVMAKHFHEKDMLSFVSNF